MNYVKVLEYTVKQCRKRFNDLMIWIDAVERKSATLIAINGVIIALSVSLVNMILNNWDKITQNDIHYVFILISLYILLVIAYITSIILAYAAHNVETYQVPPQKKLIKMCKCEKKRSKKKLLSLEINNLIKSNEGIRAILIKKAKYIHWSQISFIIGCIFLCIDIFMLLFGVILITPN